MREHLQHAAKKHSFLWWSTLCVTGVFLVFFTLVYVGHIEIYAMSMAYFSPTFFVVSLVLTVSMAYHRAHFSRGDHKWGPFLCTLLFAVTTQFINFVLAPWMDWSLSMSPGQLIRMNFFFIIPSLLAFLVLRALVRSPAFDRLEDYTWFNWNLYLNWVEFMANIMTVVCFVNLFLLSGPAQEVMGLRGTIWAFYSIAAAFIGDHLFKDLRFAKESQ